jgi:hypothetical protein
VVYVILFITHRFLFLYNVARAKVKNNMVAVDTQPSFNFITTQICVTLGVFVFIGTSDIRDQYTGSTKGRLSYSVQCTYAVL